MGCRDNEDLNEKGEASATDLKQRHDVTAKTQQFIEKVWPGLWSVILLLWTREHHWNAEKPKMQQFRCFLSFFGI